MARMLSKTLVFRSSIDRLQQRHRPSFLRYFSSEPQLIEFDLDSFSSSASATNKMEEIIHNIIVQKSTPDWLPFLPGSSFWVPQPRQGSKRVSDFVDLLSNQLTQDEFLSLTTGRGWPCLPFFVSDKESMDVNLKAVEEVEMVVSIDSVDKST